VLNNLGFVLADGFEICGDLIAAAEIEMSAYTSPRDAAGYSW
jgi:hypothetical protein